MAKRIYQKLTTPLGTIKYSNLIKPNTKFNPDGEYSIDLLLEDASEFEARLKALAEDARKTLMASAQDGKAQKAIEKAELHYPLKPEEDEDGNETGKSILKAKKKLKGAKKDGTAFETRVLLFDAEGKEIKGDPKAGRGSKVRVAVTVAPFFSASTKKVGITLWLEAVQIVELIEYGAGGSASSFGFTKEDGYKAEEASPDPTEFEQVAKGGDSNGDF